MTYKNLCWFMVVMIIFAFSMSESDAEMQRATYCEMVQTWKDTNGDYGHPDFRQNAGRVCK